MFEKGQMSFWKAGLQVLEAGICKLIAKEKKINHPE